MYNAEPEIVEELKTANLRFYDAFTELGIQYMDEIWEDSDRALCVHPGWQPLVGWQPIRESWERIFASANLMQFNIRYLNVVVQGNFGYVTCIEEITSVVQGKANNFSAYATNIFAHTESGWRMIAHHASPGS